MGCCNVNQDNQYDLVIIGGGSAAFAAAIKANEHEAHTLLINGGLPLGGTCVNVGCVPSKFLIRAAENVHKASHSPFNGVAVKAPQIAFNEIIQQKRELVGQMQQRKYVDLLADMPFVQIVEGFAEFVGDRTVQVGNEQYEGLKVIIATGATTYIPNIEGLDTVPYLTNESLFELEEQPESLIILGAGYIALEIAQAYNRLGTKVTILQRSASILSSQTKDVTDELSKYLEQEGITILTNTIVNTVRSEGGGITVEYTSSGSRAPVNASHLLVATGINPKTERLGLDKVGVKVDEKGHVVVDSELRTSNPDIFAVGDVTNLPAYVYTAAYEGSMALHNAFYNPKQKVDFKALPWVMFTDPQVAGVGIDESEAEQRGIPYHVTTLPLTEVPRSIVALDTRGFIKLIRNPETDLLLGARIVAPEGSELIMEISLAIKYNISVSDLISMFHPYLTLSEGIKLAAMSFSMDVKKMSCCAS
jgi:mercuric reductase